MFVKCLNYGCESKSTYDSHHKRYKPFCNRCEKHNRDEACLLPGVTKFKQHKCANFDGSVLEGIKCPINMESLFVQSFGLKTHIDHIDGDPSNNIPENCVELCADCHDIKSKWENDYAKGRNKFHFSEILDLTEI